MSLGIGGGSTRFTSPAISLSRAPSKLAPERFSTLIQAPTSTVPLRRRCASERGRRGHARPPGGSFVEVWHAHQRDVLFFR
jgi:hypothetical protein